MKKLTALGLGVCAVLAFSSCKSSESAYKKAYEKAKQQELAAQTTEPVQAAPVVTAPTTTTTTTPRVVETATVANTAGVRQEKVEMVSGTGNLKDFSVVCGSFGVKANAESLKDYLAGQGYPSLVAVAETREGRMYRVIVASYDSREEAAGARDAFKAKYPNRADFQGSWLLYRLK
jgi:cell division protein FtsN